MQISESRRSQLTWGGTAVTTASLIGIVALKRFAAAQAFDRWSKPLGLTAVGGGVTIAIGQIRGKAPLATGEVTAGPEELILASCDADGAVFKLGEATIELQKCDPEWKPEVWREALQHLEGTIAEDSSNGPKALEDFFFGLLQKKEPLKLEFLMQSREGLGTVCPRAVGLLYKGDVLVPALIGAISRHVAAKIDAEIVIAGSFGIRVPLMKLVASEELPIELGEANKTVWVDFFEPKHPLEKGDAPLFAEQPCYDERFTLPSGSALEVKPGDYWVPVTTDGFKGWVPSRAFKHESLIFDGRKISLQADEGALSACKNSARSRSGFGPKDSVATIFPDEALRNVRHGRLNFSDLQHLPHSAGKVKLYDRDSRTGLLVEAMRYDNYVKVDSRLTREGREALIVIPEGTEENVFGLFHKRKLLVYFAGTADKPARGWAVEQPANHCLSGKASIYRNCVSLTVNLQASE